jgi:methylated-DNA-[protein]-cysteine S-methyltransferase
MNFPTSTFYTKMTSPLGTVILSATDLGLSGIWFDGQKHLPPFKEWQPSSNNAYLLKAQDSLQAYFNKQTKRFEISLDFEAASACVEAALLAAFAPISELPTIPPNINSPAVNPHVMIIFLL